MKKLLFLFAFVPFFVNAQTPAALVDLSEYHDDDKIMDMVDENFTDITDGTYGIPALTVTGVLSANGGVSSTSTVLEITTIATLTATEIVGTDAGDVGHADGAILVAAPGTGYALEFVSAFLVYDYGVATYTGGADDAVIQVGVTGTQVAVTGAITGASLLEAAADAMLRLGSTATELVYADNGVISLHGTALTQPGTAAGVLRVHITYRRHTTGL